jgi:hypothetical protein
MNRILALTGALVLATGLSACGKVGQLERPGPMFGKASAAPADVDGARPQDPSRPLETVDPRDRSADPTPAR